MKATQSGAGSSQDAVANQQISDVRSEEPSPQVDISDIANGDGDAKDDKQENGKNKKRKIPGLRSEIWNHFQRVYNEVEQLYIGRCKYCQSEIKADGKRHGNSSMWSHYRSCKESPHEVETNQQRLMFQPARPNQRGGLMNWQFNQEKVMEALCQMIVIDEMPFRTVEKRGFRLFLEAACPMFSIPARKTLTKNIYQMYLNEKSRLMSFMKAHSQRVSITTDTWTSVQRVNYMCLTVHFVDDDWNLHKRVLNFCTISGHKSIDVGKDVEKCPIDWGLDKISTITVDNASSNDGAVDHLKTRYGRRNGSIVGGKYMHMRCIAHILNLVVQDGLKDEEECVARIRAAVKYARSSPGRYKKFKSCVERAGLQTTKLLCLDVPTRWNSTYLMLEAALSLRKAFEEYEYDDSDYASSLELGVPTSTDWDRASHMVSFLVQFFRLTNRISGSLYVTSNVVFTEISRVEARIAHLMDPNTKCDEMLRSMAIRMRAKLSKYWGATSKMNKILYFAVILDPRYKLGYLEFSLKMMFSHDPKKAAELTNEIIADFEVIYNEYKKLYDVPASPISSRVGESSSSTDLRCDPLAEYRKLMAQQSKQQKSELEKYYQDDCEADPEDKEFDILKWWKGEAQRFPIISKMARDTHEK